jgi:hypothetical protein
MIKTIVTNLTEIRDYWKTDEKIRHTKLTKQISRPTLEGCDRLIGSVSFEPQLRFWSAVNPPSKDLKTNEWLADRVSR